jgi:hypothetical protein
MDPGALVRTPSQTETQAGNGNSRFGAEGFQVELAPVRLAVVRPPLKKKAPTCIGAGPVPLANSTVFQKGLT